MGPKQTSSALFWKVFGLLRVAEKSSRKAVDGKEDWVLYPALSQTGRPKRATTNAADDPAEKAIVRGMFDIVSGRETRAAVLLAGFAPDRKVRKQPIDIDGLRLSMESQFKYCLT